jgi:predicted MFS family arabinose efflux permease
MGDRGAGNRVTRSAPRSGLPRPRLLAAVVAGISVGAAGMNAAPLLLGAYVDHRGFDEPSAAGLASAELVAAAAISILAAGLVARHSRRRLALWGSALMLAAQAASMAAFAFVPLLVARAVAGVGAGLAGAAANAAAAGTRDPDRLFATAVLLDGLLAAFALALMGRVVSLAGAAGAFAMLGAVALVAAPLLRWLPDPAPPHEHEAARARHRGRAALALVALFVDAVGQGAVWSFNERIGHALGLSTQEAGAVLGGVTLVGLAGAAFAVWLGTRSGRTVPLVTSLVGVALSTLVLVTTDDRVVFVLADAAWALCFYFSTPYLLGTLAALDPRGRWNAAGAGVAAIGAAVGPVVAGALVARASYEALGGLVIGCGAVSIALLLPVLLFLDRGGSPVREP